MPVRKYLLALALCFPCIANAGVGVGDTAPEVSLASLSSDTEVSLSSLRGKVVYLDFWASWCGPCRVSFPILENLRAELGGQGFEVLAVSVDEEEADARDFLNEVSVSYPVVLDSSGATPTVWAPPGMPTGYLIDRQGVVRGIHAGFKKSDGDKLRVAITKLLGE